MSRSAVPQGDLYPNGVPITEPNAAVQSTVHVPGTFFQKSVGFQGVRPGKHRLQPGYKSGIHFTPHRFAEDVGATGFPVMVDKDAGQHADIAELPGSERLDDEGKTTSEDDRVLLAEDPPIRDAESRESQWAQLADWDGIRNETRRWSRGLLMNPVDFLSDEVRKTPVKAVLMATGIVGAVYIVARDFERAYGRRRARGAGAAAPAAAATDTAGTTVEKVIEAPAKVVETVGDTVQKVAETAGDAVKEVTEEVGNKATE